MGDAHTAADPDDPHVDTKDEIRKVIEKARKQLKKDAEIFNLAMDNPLDCQVTKVIAVPNVSRHQVTTLIAKNKDYEVSRR